MEGCFTCTYIDQNRQHRVSFMAFGARISLHSGRARLAVKHRNHRSHRLVHLRACDCRFSPPTARQNRILAKKCLQVRIRDLTCLCPARSPTVHHAGRPWFERARCPAAICCFCTAKSNGPYSGTPKSGADLSRCLHFDRKFQDYLYEMAMHSAEGQYGKPRLRP